MGRKIMLVTPHVKRHDNPCFPKEASSSRDELMSKLCLQLSFPDLPT